MQARDQVFIIGAVGDSPDPDTGMYPILFLESRPKAVASAPAVRERTSATVTPTATRAPKPPVGDAETTIAPGGCAAIMAAAVFCVVLLIIGRAAWGGF